MSRRNSRRQQAMNARRREVNSRAMREMGAIEQRDRRESEKLVAELLRGAGSDESRKRLKDAIDRCHRLLERWDDFFDASGAGTTPRSPTCHKVTLNHDPRQGNLDT